ncbi:uncharacterized protein LOC100469322 isoform X4 [Ailuropoda melanoleuca]|uniref:uncharacterized protein LOC100469322 isoform X4 n=1 Tax=Ailuropoda melanoleuca TaxID=9646 RepID=UPI0014943E09|nr:uncharacterized protein LOC100469322 isoform X4 [Ailuropoda melanoleuca]
MYFFMLLLFGIPLLYMEMIMGHWLRVNNIRVWKQLIPWLGGIGYASILVCILMSLYNSIILTWSISYLGNSFDNSLPWNQCPLVKTINVTDLSCLRTVTHQYFWYHTTLSASGHIEEGVEALVLHLTLGIFAAWCLLFLTMITKLKTSMTERHKSDEPDKKRRAASGCQAPRRHPTPARPRLSRVDQQSPSTPPVPGHPLLPNLQHQDTEGKVHAGPRPGIRSLLPSRLVVPWCLFLGHPLLPGPGHHRAEHLVKDLGRHRLSPPGLHLHLQEVSQAAVRVREEIFGDLGRLLWSFFTVLWCYVTLPGLLALTTICIMQLYQTEPPYYIAWNSSMVRFPSLASRPYSGHPSSDLPFHRTLGLGSFHPQLASFPAPGEPDPQHHMD